MTTSYSKINSANIFPTYTFRVNLLDNTIIHSSISPDTTENMIYQLSNATVYIDGIKKALKHGETILSLMNEATMVFEKGKTKHSLVLPARSLVQMKDEIREQWLHSILPVKNTRYSIVFRCSS